MAPGADVINVFYGENIDKREAETLLEYTRDTYPSVEAELEYGGQAVYHYIISSL
jgi:dihydroxyacetone kinase-like predicted kinase